MTYQHDFVTYKCGSYADQGLNKIPDSVTDEQALLVDDVLATGFWAARISEITEDDTVLIIGAGPTGLCTLMCVLLKNPKRVIVCEKDPARIAFVHQHYPHVLTCEPENCKAFTASNSDHAANDVVLIVMWTMAAAEDISYLSVIICFVMFLVNDLYGFVSWKRMEQRQMASA